MKKQVDILIDGDPVCYACGFAAQSTSYQVVVELPDGELQSASFVPQEDKKAGDQMKAWISSLPEGCEVVSKEKQVVAEPVDNALQAVKTHLDSVHRAIVGRYPGYEYGTRVFLTGSDNYRNTIATRAVYKGNRKDVARPVHYQAIRDFLIKQWDTTVSQGNEADDLISIHSQHSRNAMRDFVVVSIDKDLDMIPGPHYSPHYKLFYVQDDDSARLWFYQQAISGDATDNIPGAYKLGKEKAKKYVDEAADGMEQIGPAEEKELWEAVLRAYADTTTRTGCPYTKEEAPAVALETARLVWLQTYPGEIWEPRK